VPHEREYLLTGGAKLLSCAHHVGPGDPVPSLDFGVAQLPKVVAVEVRLGHRYGEEMQAHGSFSIVGGLSCLHQADQPEARE